VTSPPTTKTSPPSAPSGLLVVDKSEGPTSHDVVAVARRALGTKAVGHTGTLDPMATGVLLLAIGEGTKLVSMLGGESKVYRTTIRFGVETHTLDAQGEVVAEAMVPPLDVAKVAGALQAFLGQQSQVPPKVSAIKQDGQSAHARARRGEDFDLDARSVRLDNVEVHGVTQHEADITLRCGKGFYVRSLARDLAYALGTFAHLTQLRRLENAGFRADDGVSFEALLRAAKVEPALREGIRARILPLSAACQRLPHVRIAEEGVIHLRHGRPWDVPAALRNIAADGAELIALDEAGVPRAIVRVDGGRFRVQRGLNAD
jgi:tRNA pseudouridine55 synthase